MYHTQLKKSLVLHMYLILTGTFGDWKGQCVTHKESGPLYSLASLSSFLQDKHGAGPKPRPFGNYAYVCHLLLLFCLQPA